MSVKKSPHPTIADSASDDITAIIARNPCSSQFKIFEDCLVRTDRNFKACQQEVKELRLCSEKHQKEKKNI